METCLDEGTLQAYLDGELSPETLNRVALHLAACRSAATGSPRACRRHTCARVSTKRLRR